MSPSLHGKVRGLAEYRARRGNVLIVHASIGHAAVHQFLMDRYEPLVLMYHNVTPASYYEPYDAEFAEVLALGRREVELLRPRVVRALAASRFNAEELENMGYEDVRVVPPIVDFQRLARTEPNETTLHYLAGFEGRILLSVGQLMPHKRPDFLVEMAHIGSTYLDMRAFVMLVGHHRVARYAKAIRDQVRELSLNRVHIVGAVSERDLAAMFQSADAVVTASEHEGFCVPLIEAMAMGKPVVARALGAIPETVGDAGLLLPAKEGPTYFAEAVAELLANAPLREHLVERGHARVASFEESAPDVTILETLLEVV
jgi:glycosyltransferase involved in cell wall biosynthesis